MGGHGGLNILPQKKWHLYRPDNRAKVARDEAEDRRNREHEEQRRRVLQLDLKISRLKARAVEAGLEKEGNVSDVENNGNPNGVLFSRSEASALTPSSDSETREKKRERPPVRSEDPFQPRRRPDDKTSTCKKSNQHINFFTEAEQQYNKAAMAHSKYLAQVGHEATDVSEFDRILSQTSSPWYLQRPKQSNWVQEKQKDQTDLQLEGNPSSSSLRTYRKQDAGKTGLQGSHALEDNSRGHHHRSDAYSSRKKSSVRNSETKRERRKRKQAKYKTHIEQLRRERIARERIASSV